MMAGFQEWMADLQEIPDVNLVESGGDMLVPDRPGICLWGSDRDVAG